MHKSLEKFAPYIEKGLLRQVISPCKKLVLYIKNNKSKDNPVYFGFLKNNNDAINKYIMKMIRPTGNKI